MRLYVSFSTTHNPLRRGYTTVFRRESFPNGVDGNDLTEVTGRYDNICVRSDSHCHNIRELDLLAEWVVVKR